MRRFMPVPVAIFLLFPAGVFAAWEDYRPSTLAQVLAANPPENLPAPAFELTQVPVKARVVYKGSGRKTMAEKRRLIAAWLKSRGLPKAHADLFGFEILVAENGTAHWLPIQNSLARDLRNDAKLKNAAIDVYVNFLGYFNKTPVFIVNRFDELS